MTDERDKDDGPHVVIATNRCFDETNSTVVNCHYLFSLYIIHYTISQN